MTREEARKILQKLATNSLCVEDYSNDKIKISSRMGAQALRSVSRKQVEKVWRAHWMGSADGYADGELVYDIWECSHCGYVIDEEDDPDMLPQFCPKCGTPMTNEAVDMMLERLGVLSDDASGDSKGI